MTVPRTAYHAYAPAKSQLQYIDAARHFGVFRVVTDGFGGSVSTEARMWLSAYERFGDDFEEAAKLYDPRNVGLQGKLHPYIDDPWKLTGYTHDEVSLATHYVAAMSIPPLLREHTGHSGLTFLMRTVARHGMAPDSLIDCADWHSRGIVIAPEAWTYHHGWATLLFGTPAGSWTGEDMQWLVEFDDKKTFRAAYTALTGITSALTQTRAKLPFPVLQAVLVNGVAPEYAMEALGYAS